MGNFLDSVERSNVIEGINAGRQSAVEAEDLIVDKGGKGEVVEEICKVFPDIGIAVLAQTLVVEAIDLSDLT